MNKVIFQLGLLAFCVASVLFGIQDMSFLEVVARAFLVFVIIVCAIAAILMIASSLARPATTVPENQAQTAKAGTGAQVQAPAK